jgi:hypothetical protein
VSPITDARARNVNFISRDADWVRFEATIVTDADQTAVAPGYLVRPSWVERGRRHFHYRMDAPILNFYTFLSGRYAVRRDRWRNVAIEVYHHPPHSRNVERMIGAVKKSLDYYTRSSGLTSTGRCASWSFRATPSSRSRSPTPSRTPRGSASSRRWGRRTSTTPSS